VSELHVPQPNADVLSEGMSVLESHRTGLYGAKVTGSMLSDHLLPGRYVVMKREQSLQRFRTPISHPVGSDVTVPVHLLTSSTTHRPTTTTEIGWHDNYGCMMNDNEFFPDGAQVGPKRFLYGLFCFVFLFSSIY